VLAGYDAAIREGNGYVNDLLMGQAHYRGWCQAENAALVLLPVILSDGRTIERIIAYEQVLRLAACALRPSQHEAGLTP